MNIYKSRTLLMGFVALQLLTISAPTCAYSKKDRKKRVEVSFADVAVPMTIAGAALGLLGAACLYDQTSEEKYRVSVDYAARTSYDYCCTRYNHMIQIMRDAYLLPSISQNLYQKSFKVGVSENVLYQLASNKRDQKIDAYSNRLRNDITELQCRHEQILFRTNDLRDKKVYGFSFTLFDAEELRTLEYTSRDLVQFSINLETLSACLDYHRAYFALYDVENALWARYPDELAGLYNKSYSYNILVDYLRNISWRKNVTSYAYNAYVSQINQDIFLLQNALNATPYYYADRLGAAQELHNQLDFLYGVLLAHQ